MRSMTTADVAARLRVSVRRVRQLKDAKRLVAESHGGMLWFNAASVARYERGKYRRKGKP